MGTKAIPLYQQHTSACTPLLHNGRLGLVQRPDLAPQDASIIRQLSCPPRGSFQAGLRHRVLCLLRREALLESHGLHQAMAASLQASGHAS